MAAATKKAPVEGPAGVELQRGDTVRVNGRKGSITGFTRDGDSVYVRFVEDGDGPVAGDFSGVKHTRLSRGSARCPLPGRPLTLPARPHPTSTFTFSPYVTSATSPPPK